MRIGSIGAEWRRHGLLTAPRAAVRDGGTLGPRGVQAAAGCRPAPLSLREPCATRRAAAARCRHGRPLGRTSADPVLAELQTGVASGGGEERQSTYRFCLRDTDDVT